MAFESIEVPMKLPAFASLLLAGMAVCAHGSEVKAEWCGMDRSSSLVSLEALATEQNSTGVIAQSVLKYLAEKKLTTTGYFISKSPTVRSENRVEYQMHHESGFRKSCDIHGNRSGIDGVLEVDPSTHEVKSFLYGQFSIGSRF
jgi:hypothetical protein